MRAGQPQSVETWNLRRNQDAQRAFRRCGRLRGLRGRTCHRDAGGGSRSAFGDQDALGLCVLVLVLVAVAMECGRLGPVAHEMAVPGVPFGGVVVVSRSDKAYQQRQHAKRP